MRTVTASRSSSPSPGNGSTPATSIFSGSRFGRLTQPASSASTTARVLALTVAIALPAPRQRTAANPLAELGEADADRGCCARQQARGREPRQRVDLEAPDAAVLVHAEIDAAVRIELQRTVHTQREILRARR